MNSIKVMIDEGLKAENSKYRERSGKWNPSQLGGCLRKQVFNRKDASKTNESDDRALRVFKCGELFHKFVQDTVVKNNPAAQVEVLVNTDDVCGYADIVTDDEVIEIKSQHSRAFWHMEKENVDITESKPNHCYQVMTYCHFLKKPQGRLVYISKDDLCIAEYILPFTPQWAQKVTDELAVLNDYWSKTSLPPAEPRLYKQKTEWAECGYCDWKDACFAFETQCDRPEPNKLKEVSNG